MLIFKRPAEPPSFAEAVAEEKKKIEKFFRNIKRAASRNSGGIGDSPPAEKIEFMPKWGSFKTFFTEAQYDKCGYCEIMVTAGQDGDVEHFFPKGEIWKLDDKDEASWGQERDWSAAVAGRKRPVISEQGYWWMAYEWSNYLLSCAVCNQKWKLSFFPVNDDPRPLPPVKRKRESVLLLNPFDEKLDPALHLKFGRLGEVEAIERSPYGFETIRTCGLDRLGLRRSREEKAERAYQLLIELRDAIKTADPIKERKALEDIYGMGRVHRAHSGMVRIIFQQGSGLKWSDLEKLVEK